MSLANFAYHHVVCISIFLAQNIEIGQWYGIYTTNPDRVYSQLLYKRVFIVGLFKLGYMR